MKFRAHIKSYSKGIRIMDGRGGSAGDLDIGGNQMVTIDGTPTFISNTRKAVVLNTFNGDPNTWNGMYIVFTSGPNLRMGAGITTTYREDSSGDICWLILDRRLQFIPTANNTFTVFGVHPLASAIVSGPYLTLEKEMDSVTFNTDVDNGYTTCEITLNEHSNHLGRIFSSLMGEYLILEDVYGHTCFCGIITGINIDGFGGSISVTGLRRTFEWYILDNIEWATPITSTDIIRDVVQTNPFVDYKVNAIDAQDIWKNAQTSGSISVGPRDYTESNNTAAQILQEIIDLGHYGALDGTSEDKIALQVWDQMHPVLRVIKRYPQNPTDVNYIIPTSAFEYNYKGFSLQVDVANTEGVSYATYTDANGLSANSPIAVNMNIVQQFGFRNKVHSISDQQEGSAASAAEMMSLDTSTFGGPGSLSLHGYVKAPHGITNIPVHYIRAGSVVKAEGQIGYSSLYRNMNFDGGLFRVGSTSYNSSSEVMTITVHEIADIKDFFSKRIELEN